ncbi:tripartite tricarboxylate transporter substrate binding protein [Achromobacter sp. Marseille-Q0513]|uniref:tripartite tricarboxylate transporter substrate binding protein n=1 Tax=Achromobacter sp. Marseille-Q0513 TaxID=2829161 RepID=UPI001BA01B93|nr:tripartite tricarboxylate transporter substrate binding protein [Achromobacter sp. Marseille-Q0513]MBR8653167.1 tripartite tricarboxylate transporter substrate binding protein [Achromobacter sp. Marseille-Q0513]
MTMQSRIQAACGALAKKLLPAAFVAAALAGPLPAAHADEFPSKPIKLIVPFAAGGGNDGIARLLGQLLSDGLKQPVVVENRPGAGGKLGVEQGLRAEPDGYTLTLISNSYSVNPSLYSLPFDPVGDMTPIGMIARAPFFVSVHPSVPVDNLAGLVDLAKKKPGQLAYASSGTGGISHLAMEAFLKAAGISMTHVPYKGSAPALTDTVSGQVQAMLTTAGSTLPYRKDGRLKVLAVTLPERVSSAPDVPTVREAGVPFDVTVWYGIIAPKGVPPAIQARLNAAINAAVVQPDMAERLKTTGEEAAPSSPAAFQEQIVKEIALWRDVVRDAGVKVD